MTISILETKRNDGSEKLPSKINLKLAGRSDGGR